MTLVGFVLWGHCQNLLDDPRISTLVNSMDPDQLSPLVNSVDLDQLVSKEAS